MIEKGKHGGFREGSGRPPLTPEEQEKKRERRNKAARDRRAKAREASGRAVAAAPPSLPAAPKGQPAGAWGDARAMQALTEQMSKRRKRSREPEFNPFQPAQHPPAATPPKKLRMALDSGTTSWASNAWLGAGGIFGAVGAEGLQFLGYPYLSELAQRPEYRTFSETIADDATRKWIDFDVTGTIKDEEDERDDAETEEAEESGQPIDPAEEKQKREDRVKSSGKMEKVKQLKDELARLELRECMYRICRDDGFFGRSHLFMDFGDDFDDPKTMEEMKTPIGDGRDSVSQGKVGPQKPIVAVRPIEPVWCYPTTYNAVNPLRDDWYNPQVWYVMGREIHKSRLPTFVGRPVPDLLKPGYSFGGLALSQLAKPYVDIWIQTRDSVGELIHAFSTMVLLTDVQTNLAPGAMGGPGSLMARVAAFNDFRDNMNTFVLNKNSEDFKNVSVPLGGLHELQAQSQEHMMCQPAGTLIETDRGQVPIEKVTPEYRVMTRNGLAPLRWAGQTGMASELVEIQTPNSIIRATGWHPIWSETTNEFVNASDVDRSHCLLESRGWENTACRSLGAGIGGPKGKMDIIFPATAASCIAAFMRLTSGLSRRALTSIIETATRPITASIISSLSAAPITSNGNLIAAKWTALSAESLSKRYGRNGPSIARTLASYMRASSIRDGFHIENTRSNANAAETTSRANGRIAPDSVLNLARAVPITRVSVVAVPLQPVYNLEVAEGYLPEFFANGILVHNSVARIPDVKFTGINPSGLNASTDGTMRAYYDTIAAYQNRFMRPNLTRIVNFVQLSLWGEIDPEITFEFEGLWEMSEKEKAELQKTEAERNQTYVDMGVLAPEEIRGVLIDDPELPFGDLDPDDVPELKEEEEGGLIPPGGGRAEEAIIGEPGATPGQPGQPAGTAPPAGGHGDPAFQEEGGAAAGGAKVLPFKARGAADELDPLFASLVGDAAIEWNEGQHPRDPKGEFTSGASAGAASAAQTGATAPKPKGYGWHGGPSQHFVMPQFGLSGPPASFGEGHHWKPEPRPPLDPSTLKRVGKQMGSNPGGVFEDEKGRRFYVKEGRSKDHVRNEMTAADLYALAGAPTLMYRDVAGGAHVASEMEKLDKDRASQLSDAERKKAKRDFAAHAWTANYDAVGTGGDNLVAVHGEPFSVDLGGALEYRAQGKPKGAAFGNQVTELDSMRDPGIAPDASEVFGDITPSEFRESAARVTRISDGAIRETIKARGGTDALADKMIARRDDIAKRAKTFGAEGKPEKKTSTVIFPAGDALPVKTLNGVAFKAWEPPKDGDWNEVDGQMDIEAEEPLPEHAAGKQLASGVVIREKDGRVWLVQPKGAFGGYQATFPKGRVEPTLSMQANAIKEAWEESGLKVRIAGVAGDRVGDTTLTRYYFAEREGGDPSQTGDETEGVVLAPANKLAGFLNRERDQKLAKEVVGDAWNESDHPRGQPGNAGEFGPGGGGKGSSEKIAQSPAFKKWFGKSKVVDDDGRPRVAYKAMQGDAPHIQEDTGMTHVALERGVAEAFAGKDRPVQEVYVKAERPFDFRNAADVGWLTKEMAKPKNVALFNKQTKEIMGPDYDHEADGRQIAGGIEDGAYQIFEIPMVRDLIRERGHDGIYMVEEGQSGEPNLAVFDPGQIKHAGKNKGAFDPKKPGIYDEAFDEEPGAPRTLYVNRPLLNAGDLAAWAREHGVKKLLPAEDMHVTVAFSKAPVEWDAITLGATKVVAEGGKRSVERLGNEGAVVLRFECPALERDWRRILDAGASWDHPGYKPHVTFTMGDVEVDGIEPYDGPLEFGPEEWDEIGTRPADWAAKAKASLVAADAWEEGKHKRGQPENKGQFGPGGGGAGGQAKRTTAGRPQPRRGSGAVLRSQSQGAAQAASGEPKHDSGKLLEKATADALAKATPKQREQAADHDKRTKEFFASEPARKSMAKAVTAFAKKHAAAFANYHLTDAIMLPGIHHVVEQAVSAVGMGSVPGLTLGATAVAAYAANQLIERYHLNLSGAKELLAPVVRGAIDVLGNVKETSARIADLEKRNLLGAEDENRDPSVLDSLILLLIEVEKLGEEEQAQDEAPFEESKHPRDAHGEFTSKGNEGAGGGEEGEGVSLKVQTAQEAAGNIIATGINPVTQPDKFWTALSKEDGQQLLKYYGGGKEAQQAMHDVYYDPAGAGEKAAALEGQPLEHGSNEEAFQDAVNKIDEGNLVGGIGAAEAKIKAAIAHGLPPDEGLVIGSLTDDEMEAVEKKYGGLGGAYTELKSQQAGEIEKETTVAPAQTDKKTKFGGLWKTQPGNDENGNIQFNAGFWLVKPTNAGSSYRSMLAYLIKNGPGAGLDAETVGKLQIKMVEALYKANDKAMQLGKEDDVKKIAAALNKIGGKQPLILQAGMKAWEAAKSGKPVVYEAPKPSVTAQVAAQALKENPKMAAVVAQTTPKTMSDLQKYTPAFAEKLKQIATAYPVASINSSSAKIIAAIENNATLAALEVALKPAEKKKLEAKWGTLQAAWEKYDKSYGPNSPSGKFKATKAQAEMPTAVNPDKPTDAELAKAKKTAPLQLQYVPNAPQGSAEAQKLVDEFNAKWSGKEVSDADAMTKIADFKAMAEKMKPLMSAAQKAAAQKAEVDATAAAKAQAEYEANQKKAAEEVKQKNKKVMADLGIDDNEATGFNALVEMMGSSQQDVVEQFKHYQKEAESHGYPVSGFQYALARNYVDGGYSKINNALRSGSWSQAQHVYAKLMNDALDKMPKYKGDVLRGTQLDDDQVALYKPGYVVEERGFTSTGINNKFGGNVSYHIKAIGKRGADFSGGLNTGEKEVLFKAHTYFLVHKVYKSGSTTHIDMEEIDTHG